MKKIIQLVIILIMISNCFAQSTFDKSINEASKDLADKLILKNKKRIVVLYITDISKTQTVAGKYIADVISVSIINNAGNFEVFDRENLSGIAEAKKLITEGYIDVDKAKSLGRMLSVEVIIIGNYTVLSKTLKLTLKAFDSNTGLVIAATGKELLIDDDAGTLLGINVNGKETKNNNTETVNKDCETNNTGDYCFQNNTMYNLDIRLSYGGNGWITKSMSATIQPGQKQCFYDLQAGSVGYYIFGATADYHSASRSSPQRGSAYKANGYLYVEKCKEKTFIIK